MPGILRRFVISKERASLNRRFVFQSKRPNSPLPAPRRNKPFKKRLKSNVVGWRKMHPSANRSFRGRWGRFFKILRR
jgi:hypothetical protein